MSLRPLPLGFFHRPAAEVARDLLGAVVVSRLGHALVSGRIVETEAYLGFEDPASHAYRGRRNAQNAGIYSLPGSWYVYRSYGMHWCANLVCAPEGYGAAVLIRGLEPLEGVGQMRRRRGPGRADAVLCAGPGRLCQALGIDRSLDAKMMRSSPVLVLRGSPVDGDQVQVTPRVGIRKATEWPLRYLVSSRRP